jgi:hypothetical protein
MAIVEWRCNKAVHRRFKEYLDLLSGLDEGSDDYEEMVDTIRGLPGFPNNYDQDWDEIVPVSY